MKTIKIFSSFAAFLFCVHALHAQDSSKAFYFPHKTGDMWEYFYDEGPMYVDTLQIFTVSDSTDSQGIIYFTQHARFINPTENPALINTPSKYWLDTVNHYVYGRGSEIDSALLYKLNAEAGEKWLLKAKSGEMARVIEKWAGTLFGKPTTFMDMMYYSSRDSTDTTGLSRYGDVIADGFGLIYRGSSEGGGEINIMGTIINGYQYGHITVVSVKDDKMFLPSGIELYENYPNPFNPSTTISFNVLTISNISLILYDITGNEVFRLINNEEYEAGVHKVVWNGLIADGSKAASGIYFYRLITNKEVITRSMILLK